MTKPLAYSYIRMSTERQLKGDSLRRQMELSQQFAIERGLELVDNFELHDIAVSAFKGDNLKSGALGKFLDAVNYGEIPKGSYLLVESFDRLSRQNIDIALSLFLQITNSGINIATLTDGQIYKAHETKFEQLIYSIVVMARAHEESETKSKRISAAWASKRANIGKQILTRTRPAWLEVAEDKTKFVPVPERVATVQRIFSEGSSGKGSYSITRRLNEDGVLPFGRSNGWIESYVSKILKNRAVLGEFQPCKKIEGKRVPVGDVIEDYFPRIIDEDIFLKVQVDRRVRSVHGGGRKGKHQRNLFTHLVKCEYCGASMRFVDKGNGPKGGKYFKCSAAVRGMGCLTKSWRYAEFESSFFYFVREIDLTSVIEKSSDRILDSNFRKSIDIELERIRNLEIRRDRILDFAVSGDAAESYLADKVSAISSEIETIGATIISLQDEKSSIQAPDAVQIENVQEQIESIRNFSQSDNVEKRELVSSRLMEFVKEIRVAVDGNKPGFDEKIKLVAGGFSDDLEYRNKIIESIKAHQKVDVLANPHFMVSFYDGTNRLVVPDPDDPTRLLRKGENLGASAFVEDGDGNLVYPKW